MMQNGTLSRPDGDLIRRCIENDKAAQEELYGMIESRMFSVCLRYAGDRERARDLLHDGFILLLSKLDTYKGDGSFEGWARRIFINTALMQIRKADALRQAEELEQIPVPETALEPSVLEHIHAEDLMKLVARMPTGFRTVFNLYAVEGFSHQEISKMLRISEAGSRSQLNRARMWLRERLKTPE